MKIPYTEFPARPDAVFPNRLWVARPIASILLQRDEKSLLALAIVDSGADTCLFPASFASSLGISIPNPNAYVFSGTADHPQIAYFANIKVTLLNVSDPAESASFDLYAGFCDTLEHVGLGLLGQQGFFSRFEVCFDQKAGYFEIK